jgi:hypothetical protein
MRRDSRGQVLPLWVVAIMTTFVLMFMALNYGNVIRWQVRAQSAADSAAQAFLSVQTQRWNMTMETMYAANVEEFRIRRLMNGILMTMENSGGCAQASTCPQTYMALRSAYLQAVNRYTADVNLMNNVASYAAQNTATADASNLLAHMAKSTFCNSSGAAKADINVAGVDCGFTYTVAGISQRTGLQDLKYDAQGICIPGLGRTCSGAPDTEANDFAPLQVDVVACAIVPPAIPSFWMFQTQPYYAIGRAAATAVMFEEDWFEPGALYDSVRGPNVFFQPSEKYDTTPATGYDWYLVNFGGNGATAYSAYNAFTEPVDVDEMSARLGWWNSIPIKPFAPASSINLSADCKTS